jgi:hypothetical protein
MSTDEPNKEEPQESNPTDPHTLNYARPGTQQPGMTLVTIATFGHSWEAHLAAGKLEAAGVPVVLADENINAVGGGLYATMSGGIKLQVPQIDAERALEILPSRVRIAQVKCPRCSSADTRQIDFTPGLKICFLLMLGIPYLFIKKPWICLSCSNVWRAAPGKSVANHVDDEDDEDNDDDDDQKSSSRSDKQGSP